MALVFASVSLLAAAALVGLSLWLRARSKECLSWSSVMGRITESRVDDEYIDMTKPVLRCHYDVAGRTYVGFRASFSGYGVSRAAMDELVRSYVPGQSVGFPRFR
jgi:hypothetical protein